MAKRREGECTMVGSFLNMKRVCNIIRALSIVCLIFFAIIYVAFLVACLLSPEPQQALGAIVYTILHGTMICAIFTLIILGLSDVMKGHSPFTDKQVRRLVVAGFLFLAIALVELVFPLDMSWNLAGGSEAHIMLDASTISAGTNVNVAALLFAFASFCLSAIFKYGIILQKLSDDTV